MSTDFERGRETAGLGNHDGDTDVSEGRRDFLKGVLAAGGTAASLGTVGVLPAQAQPGMVPGTKNHYYVPATDKTVHWGYFSKSLKPLIRGQLWRLRHHRGPHAPRQRRRRADDQG